MAGPESNHDWLVLSLHIAQTVEETPSAGSSHRAAQNSGRLTPLSHSRHHSLGRPTRRSATFGSPEVTFAAQNPVSGEFALFLVGRAFIRPNPVWVVRSLPSPPTRIKSFACRPGAPMRSRSQGQNRHSRGRRALAFSRFTAPPLPSVYPLRSSPNTLTRRVSNIG